MTIKSYEIRNSLGLINIIERTSMGWFDNVAKKTLNSTQKDELLKSYRSFNCQLQTIYGEPELPEIPSDCISIEFIAVHFYTKKETLIYKAARADDHWLFGIKKPSARCEEKYIQDMILMYSKKRIEVRYFDKNAKRITA